jgi:uncharacterized protein with HEPN domain
LDSNRSNRLVRSLVDRELTIIGEAIITLARTAPVAFASMTQTRRIVDFRNQLTHEYPSVDGERVWGFIDGDAPVLRRECAALMDSLASAGEAD